jgi:hypothetical protein
MAAPQGNSLFPRISWKDDLQHAVRSSVFFLSFHERLSQQVKAIYLEHMPKHW